MFSKFMFAFLPYLSKLTYHNHLYDARMSGFRIEDQYENKFWKEP
jgi:hypothetical protein